VGGTDTSTVALLKSQLTGILLRVDTTLIGLISGGDETAYRWEQARAQTFWGAGAQTKKKGTQCQKKF